jgi:epoxyqueuosine reductase
VQPQALSAVVKDRARALGFDLCGIAAAGPLDRAPFEKWFGSEWHAGLGYMRERFEQRMDPRKLLPDAKSVVVVACSYAPESGSPKAEAGSLQIARYARNRDYHNVLLKPVRKLAAWMRAELSARVYAEVDAGAVAEKAWAQRAGIGWIGKNGCLINERLGSWLLLGALVTDLELQPDAAHADRCGECAACLPACPTDAFPEPRFVDARKCLAYHTIEHRGPIPPELAARAGARIFGCDACQDVCPWNRRAPEATLVQLRARRDQTSLEPRDALSLTDASFRERFTGTPLMRAGRDGIVRSALAVLPRPVPAELQPLVQRLTDDAADGVRVEARRALGARC